MPCSWEWFPGAASPQHPPSTGNSLNLSAQLGASFAGVVLFLFFCWTLVPLEQEMEEQSPFLSLAVFCTFPNPVTPQTRGK